MIPDVVVVGGGPAGLMAAISAAGAGASVALCERLPRAGRKLLASGGGRCNLTNTLSPDEFVMRLGRQGRFALPALTALDPTALRRFLAERGVGTESADGFRVFPSSGRSGDVLTTLLRECGRRGVALMRGTTADAVLVRDGRAEGVKTSRGPLPGRCVVLAAGGAGYPDLGGTRDGYDMAGAAGHEVRRPVPALVGLTLEETWVRGCAGVAVQGARVTVRSEGTRQSAEGDLLFTHHGLSGQAVLDVSGTAAEALAAGQPVRLEVSFVAGAERADWIRELERWRLKEGRRTVGALVAERLPRSLARALCGMAGASGLRAAALPREARDRLVRALSGLELAVAGTGGFARAMVTRGGVALRGVDPRTMSSRLIRGLLFAGEVLDVDGPSGGFNLQWAFSSGWLAGASAAAMAASLRGCDRGPERGGTQ
jgi:predicted Rossmann fold flavoprotein